MRASVLATWSKVLWLSFRTITRQPPPSPDPGPPVRGLPRHLFPGWRGAGAALLVRLPGMLGRFFGRNFLSLPGGGPGVADQEVGQLLNQFRQAQQLMKQLSTAKGQKNIAKLFR